MGRLRIGQNLGGGNPGDTVSVRLPNGEVVQAKAATEINKAKVLVATDEADKHYAYAEGEGTAPVTTRQITRQRPRRKPVDPDNDYFFKVLQADGLIEGFDDDVDLDLTGYTAIGTTNTGDGYLAILKSGNNYAVYDEGLQNLTLNASNYIDGIPSYKYIGYNNLFFWRRLTPTKSVDSISGGEGGASSFVPTAENFARSFVSPRRSPTYHNYRNPYDSSFLPATDYAIPDIGLAINSTPLTLTYKYTIGDTEDFQTINATATGVLPSYGNPNSSQYTMSWTGSYREKDEYGGLNTIVVDDYLFNGSGGGDASTQNIFVAETDPNGAIEYFTSSLTENSLYSSVYSNSQNENNYSNYTYDANHAWVYTKTGHWLPGGGVGSGGYGDIVSTTDKHESYEIYQASHDVLYESDTVKISTQDIINKIFDCTYTESYSRISTFEGESGPGAFNGLFEYLTSLGKRCVTSIELAPNQIKTLSLIIDGISYEYSSYQGGVYIWNDCFFITSNTIIAPTPFTSVSVS